MISSAGYIDALVLQPRDPVASFRSYLERRIAYARDEFAREILASVLERYSCELQRTPPIVDQSTNSVRR